jgi:hypothetical protein
VLGIDLGITMVMAENYRAGLVWEYIYEEQRSAGRHDKGWNSAGMNKCGGC